MPPVATCDPDGGIAAGSRTTLMTFARMTDQDDFLADDEALIDADGLDELADDDNFLFMAADREFRLGDGGDRIRLDGWE